MRDFTALAANPVCSPFPAAARPKRPQNMPAAIELLYYRARSLPPIHGIQMKKTAESAWPDEVHALLRAAGVR